MQTNDNTAVKTKSAVQPEKNKTGSPTRRAPFAVIEAYKNIRTNLISMLAKSNSKIIAVSSPNASEGKSTTSINIAIALSQLNKKILIVDTDVHRPSLHNKMQLKNDNGLLDVIRGVSDLESTVQPYNQLLDILTSGPIAANSTELFSDPSFDALLEQMKEKYDYIILDAPPINVVSDTLVIAQKCDGLALVLRSGITTHESLKRTLASCEILNINILGVILNGSDSGTKKYYKYY